MPTFGGRDYRANNGGNDVPRGQDRPEQEQRGFGGGPEPQGGARPPQEPYPAPGQVPERPREPYDNRGGGGGQGRGNYGGSRGSGNGGGGSYNRDPNYAFISYLYPTGKNGGFSVFLKRDMLEILKSLDDDDVIGISPSGGNNGPMGWMIYARRIPAEQKEDYRRNGGGRGRGSGGGRGDGRGGYQR